MGALVRTAALSGLILAIASCATEVRQRCSIVAEGAPAPAALPLDFKPIDELLVRQARAMAREAQDLQSPLARSFQIYFTEETLPILCSHLEQARRLAVVGRQREAGVKYQALLLAAQV